MTKKLIRCLLWMSMANLDSVYSSKNDPKDQFKSKSDNVISAKSQNNFNKEKTVSAATINLEHLTDHHGNSLTEDDLATLLHILIKDVEKGKKLQKKKGLNKKRKQKTKSGKKMSTLSRKRYSSRSRSRSDAGPSFLDGLPIAPSVTVPVNQSSVYNDKGTQEPIDQTLSVATTRNETQTPALEAPESVTEAQVTPHSDLGDSRPARQGSRRHGNKEAQDGGVTSQEDPIRPSRTCDCENGGSCILRVVCVCPGQYYGTRCQHKLRHHSCSGVKHGTWIRHGCTLCRCQDGNMMCMTKDNHDCGMKCFNETPVDNEENTQTEISDKNVYIPPIATPAIEDYLDSELFVEFHSIPLPSNGPPLTKIPFYLISFSIIVYTLCYKV